MHRRRGGHQVVAKPDAMALRSKKIGWSEIAERLGFLTPQAAEAAVQRATIRWHGVFDDDSEVAIENALARLWDEYLEAVIVCEAPAGDGLSRPVRLA